MNPVISATDWIETYTGRAFYPLRPRVEDVDILDIAHALSMNCRFNGQCKFFYSVAQHCLSVRRLLEQDGYSLRVQLLGLLHDASEAYISDLTRPVKQQIKEYWHIESQLEDAIYERFGLSERTENEMQIVKHYDNILLNTEAVQLMNNVNKWIQPTYVDSRIHIMQLSMEAVESTFLYTFGYLYTSIHKEQIRNK